MKLLVLPILIPLFTAITALFAWNRISVQRIVNVVGAFGLLAAALALLNRVWSQGIQAIQVGSWPAPFGITLVADLLSAIMLVVTALISLAVAVYSLDGMDPQRESYGYYPLFHVLLMGLCGAFLTGDIFNLYVWFEVMLIASFVLVALGGEKAQLEGAIKYVTLNLISSALLLTAVAILYGMVGTLNLADLAVHLKAIEKTRLLTTLGMLFLLAFGIKAAIFPLFFWLPASYHTPPAPVSAILAGLLTKVGVYALLRVFTLLFVHDTERTHQLLLVIGGFTMVTGVLGAVAQNEFRRILSFHIVSQIGYMIFGLGLFTPLALAGTIFFIVHNIVAKTNLFLVSGVARKLSGTDELKQLGGLYEAQPFLALSFLTSALALAGIPPLSGFWAKLVLLMAGLQAKQYVLVATALGVSLLTLFSMVKIWSEVFWKDAPDSSAADTPKGTVLNGQEIPFSALSPIVALALAAFLLGIFAEPMFSIAMRAAEQLTDPTGYIRTVLGGSL